MIQFTPVEALRAHVRRAFLLLAVPAAAQTPGGYAGQHTREIKAVDQAMAGDPFNIAFLETFSGHHATLLPPCQACTTAAPHADVQSYCAGIVVNQTMQISRVRTELATTYRITNISYEIVLLPDSVAGRPIPEPATVALLGVGLLGIGLVRGGRKQVGREKAQIA